MPKGFFWIKKDKLSKKSGNMVARSFFQPYTLTASNSITFPKQSGSPGAVVDEVAEGAGIPLDVTAYTSTTVVPKKLTTYICKYCGKTYVKRHQLMGHISKHTVNKSEVAKKYMQNPVLKRKISSIAKQNIKNFTPKSCKYCGKMFYSFPSLGGHSRSHKVNSSEIMKKVWENQEFREKRAKGLKKAQTENYWRKVSKGLEKWLKSKSSKSNTSIERLLYNGLASRGLTVGIKPQVRIGTYIVDFVYKNFRIAVDCYGDYWHKNPELYNDPARLQKDFTRMDKIKSKGYKFLFFYETDLCSNLEYCLNIVERELLLSGYFRQIGHGFVITREMIEDSLIPVQTITKEEVIGISGPTSPFQSKGCKQS